MSVVFLARRPPRPRWALSASWVLVYLLFVDPSAHPSKGSVEEALCRRGGEVDCGSAASVFADVPSRDGLVSTADDDYRLAARSPASDAGVGLVLQLAEIAPAFLRAGTRLRP